MPGEAKGWYRWRQQALRMLGLEMQQLALELEEVRAVAAAKERLLLVHLAEMEELYDLLRRRVQELEAARRQNREMFLASMEALARTLEAKDRYTRGHSARVAEYAVQLAAAVGLQGERLENLHLAASLHDLGKIGIPDEVLRKPERLGPEEYELIKTHPLVAVQILQPLAGVEGILDREVLRLVRHHHERYDGEGYPDGLRGDDIPLGARIIALADGFDAMTTDRPYRRGLAPGAALAEIRRQAGRQFDPGLTALWTSIFKEVEGNDASGNLAAGSSGSPGRSGAGAPGGEGSGAG